VTAAVTVMESRRLGPSKVAVAVTLSCGAVLALAGCGGGRERLPVLTALQLTRLAEGVAAGRGCGRPLVVTAVAAVNRDEVPASVQEQLLSDVNRIAATCSRAAARDLARRLRP
jgi:hypothetical protein